MNFNKPIERSKNIGEFFIYLSVQQRCFSLFSYIAKYKLCLDFKFY